MRRTSILAGALLLAAACASPPAGAGPAAPLPPLVARVFVQADYDEVWRRFTEPDAYAAWYSSPCLELGDAPGDRVAWGTAERTTYDGVLLEREHGRGLAHTFRFRGFGFDEPATHVRIDLVPRGEVVLVQVTHACAHAPETRALIGETGWAKSLSRLKTLLETGEAMPWPGPDPSESTPAP